MSKRLDQDINFEVGGVSCVMHLDTTAPAWYEEDRWIITPRDPNCPGELFTSRLEDVLERLDGCDENGVLRRKTRQDYEWYVHNDPCVVILMVTEPEFTSEPDGPTLSVGITLSLPDWNGDSFDFEGSRRLARLLADWTDGVPDIRFTRSNGEAIEFQNFLDGGTSPFIKHLEELDDFYSSLDE